MGKQLNLIGERFGRLTVIDQADNTPKNQTRWICRCDCGKTKTVIAGYLRSGSTSSCGCYGDEVRSKVHKKSNEFMIQGDVARIYTSVGDWFEIDVEDLEKVLQICWRNNGNDYFVGYEPKTGKKMWVHRYILGEGDRNIFVDHVDRNTRNNRKTNLRRCTARQNAMNTGLRSNNKSGVIGVYWDSNRRKWFATLRINQKSVLHKGYMNFDDAVNARYEAEMKYYGEYAPTENRNKYGGLKGGGKGDASLR